MTAIEDSWYAQLREQWRPAAVRVLLIGESAPDDQGDPARRRFFYSDRLTRHDNLFRAVVEAVLGAPALRTITSKRPYLEQLRDQGVFLIDLVPFPVNATGHGARRRSWQDSAAGCVARAAELRPEGIIVCHGPSFEVLRRPLTARGLTLLHDEPIPFPLAHWRAVFVNKVRTALARLGDGPWNHPSAAT